MRISVFFFQTFPKIIILNIILTFRTTNWKVKTSLLIMVLMANMKNDNNVKRDVNVKLKNIRTRRFRVSVVDACFTNFTHEIA